MYLVEVGGRQRGTREAVGCVGREVSMYYRYMMIGADRETGRGGVRTEDGWMDEGGGGWMED